MKFSNPRKLAEFNDWPIGGNQRGQCKFEVEKHKTRGYRVVKSTTNKHGIWCKPKPDTYGGKAVMVDGDDGRTYILQYAGAPYEFIKISSSDFKDAEPAAFPDDPRYATYSDLIDPAYEGE